eukprot:gene7304-421_t
MWLRHITAWSGDKKLCIIATPPHETIDQLTLLGVRIFDETWTRDADRDSGARQIISTSASMLLNLHQVDQHHRSMSASRVQTRVKQLAQQQYYNLNEELLIAASNFEVQLRLLREGRGTDEVSDQDRLDELRHEVHSLQKEYSRLKDEVGVMAVGWKQYSGLKDEAEMLAEAGPQLYRRQHNVGEDADTLAMAGIGVNQKQPPDVQRLVLEFKAELLRRPPCAGGSDHHLTILLPLVNKLQGALGGGSQRGGPDGHQAQPLGDHRGTEGHQAKPRWDVKRPASRRNADNGRPSLSTELYPSGLGGTPESQQGRSRAHDVDLQLPSGHAFISGATQTSFPQEGRSRKDDHPLLPSGPSGASGKPDSQQGRGRQDVHPLSPSGTSGASGKPDSQQGCGMKDVYPLSPSGNAHTYGVTETPDSKRVGERSRSSKFSSQIPPSLSPQSAAVSPLAEARSGQKHPVASSKQGKPESPTPSRALSPPSADVLRSAVARSRSGQPVASSKRVKSAVVAPVSTTPSRALSPPSVDASRSAVVRSRSGQPVASTKRVKSAVVAPVSTNPSRALSPPSEDIKRSTETRSRSGRSGQLEARQPEQPVASSKRLRSAVVARVPVSPPGAVPPPSADVERSAAARSRSEQQVASSKRLRSAVVAPVPISPSGAVPLQPAKRIRSAVVKTVTAITNEENPRSGGRVSSAVFKGVSATASEEAPLPTHSGRRVKSAVVWSHPAPSRVPILLGVKAAQLGDSLKRQTILDAQHRQFQLELELVIHPLGGALVPQVVRMSHSGRKHTDVAANKWSPPSVINPQGGTRVPQVVRMSHSGLKHTDVAAN